MDDPNRPALPTATTDDLWAATTYDFPLTIGEGPAARTVVLKLRRLDVFTRFVEDSIPLPLMMAASAVITKIGQAGDGKATDAERQAAIGEAVSTLDEEERSTMLAMLRRNAVLVSVTPKLSLDGAPGTFPVTMLDTATLLRIYNENPSDPSVPAAPRGAAAESFRGDVGGPADPAGSAGPAVLAAAEPLAVASVGA